MSLFRPSRNILPSRNVIVFGETGVGKSSVINMIAGEELAATSNGARGCTFMHDRYTATFSDKFQYHLYDTAGTNECDSGRVVDTKAIANIYRLIKDLNDGEGIHLLLFCIRAPRITEVVQRNWKLFYEIFCGGNVPVIIVVTGLENEPVMETWWKQNEGVFYRYGMHPTGHACITAIRGKKEFVALEKRYEQSKDSVRQLLEKYALTKGWKRDTESWFGRAIQLLRKMFPLPSRLRMAARLARTGLSMTEVSDLLEKMKHPEAMEAGLGGYGSDNSSMRSETTLVG